MRISLAAGLLLWFFPTVPTKAADWLIKVGQMDEWDLIVEIYIADCFVAVDKPSEK